MMRLKKIFSAALIMATLLLLSPNAFPLTFMGIDQTGARYYKCGYSCGKFKVIRKAKYTYRIFSIYFSGEVKANSFKEAAELACKESDGSFQKMTNPLPSRGGSSC